MLSVQLARGFAEGHFLWFFSLKIEVSVHLVILKGFYIDCSSSTIHHYAESCFLLFSCWCVGGQPLAAALEFLSFSPVCCISEAAQTAAAAAAATTTATTQDLQQQQQQQQQQHNSHFSYPSLWSREERKTPHARVQSRHLNMRADGFRRSNSH